MKFREEFKMKKLLSTLIISTAAIFVGYWAMALPFHLFDTLTGIQMRTLFVFEILIYFLIFSAFFIIKEAKAERKEKCRRLKEKQIRRRTQRADELKGISIMDFDTAA